MNPAFLATQWNDVLSYFWLLCMSLRWSVTHRSRACKREVHLMLRIKRGNDKKSVTFGCKKVFFNTWESFTQVIRMNVAVVVSVVTWIKRQACFTTIFFDIYSIPFRWRNQRTLQYNIAQKQSCYLFFIRWYQNDYLNFSIINASVYFCCFTCQGKRWTVIWWGNFIQTQSSM